MGLVLRVHGSCTESTRPMYSVRRNAMTATAGCISLPDHVRNQHRQWREATFFKHREENSLFYFAMRPNCINFADGNTIKNTGSPQKGENGKSWTGNIYGTTTCTLSCKKKGAEKSDPHTRQEKRHSSSSTATTYSSVLEPSRPQIWTYILSSKSTRKM